MRRSHLLFLFCLSTALTAAADPGLTALGAVKLLPKGVAGQLALVEGYGGSPLPERWHLVAYDAKEEHGVHEYVVAGGELVASRALSQFAEELKPDDVIGAAAIKVDCDKVVKLAQQFATANKQTVASFNYELRKEGEGAAPLWHVTCVNDKGDLVGTLVVTATKGAVVTHEGFTTEPASVIAANAPPPVQTQQEPKPRAQPRPPRERVPVATPLPADDGRRNIFHRLFGG